MSKLYNFNRPCHLRISQASQNTESRHQRVLKELTLNGREISSNSKVFPNKHIPQPSLEQSWKSLWVHRVKVSNFLKRIKTTSLSQYLVVEINCM